MRSKHTISLPDGLAEQLAARIRKPVTLSSLCAHLLQEWVASGRPTPTVDDRMEAADTAEEFERRAKDYVAAKSTSVSFRADVSKILTRLGVEFHENGEVGKIGDESLPLRADFAVVTAAGRAFLNAVSRPAVERLMLAMSEAQLLRQVSAARTAVVIPYWTDEKLRGSMVETYRGAGVDLVTIDGLRAWALGSA